MRSRNRVDAAHPNTASAEVKKYAAACAAMAFVSSSDERTARVSSSPELPAAVERSAMTAVAMPATACPDMMAWLYTGGKTDARAKLPA